MNGVMHFSSKPAPWLQVHFSTESLSVKGASAFQYTHILKKREREREGAIECAKAMEKAVEKSFG